MPKFLQKLIFSLLTSLVLFFSFAPYLSVAAQQDPVAPAESGTWYNSNFKDWWSKVYDPNVSPANEIFGERYTAAQVQWVIYGLFAFVINSATNADVLSCLMSNATDLNACVDIIKGLLVSSTPTSPLVEQEQNENLLSLVVGNRSFSGIGYLKEKISQFSLVPEAKAQEAGFGFDALKPIQDLWSGMRDIAFGLFVLAAIIFAFMIMFRVKINPQTVITVQSAIPKLIIALILVTFSYSIAGLLVDLMYVVIGIFSIITAPFIPSVSMVGIGTPKYEAADVFRLLTSGTFKLGFNFFNIGVPFGIWGLIFMYVQPLMLILAVFWAISLALIPAGGLALIPFLLFTLLILVVFVIVLWMALKTVWALFKAFANILLLTIFAPLQIVAGIFIPSLGFGQWVKSFIANLSVFVVTGLLWLFAWVFTILALFIVLTGDFSSLAGPIGYWPPLLIFGGGTLATAFVLAGASFVFFTLIPKATEIVQGFISGKPFAYGSAIGEVFAPIATGANIGAAAFKYGPEVKRIIESYRPTPKTAPKPMGATSSNPRGMTEL